MRLGARENADQCIFLAATTESFDIYSGFFTFVYLTSIWQDFIVSNALLCFSGVTPAQQPAVTDIGTSGRNAFISKAFETTQMSVHNPISSIDSIFFYL